MTRSVLTYPDSKLSAPTVPVATVDAAVQELISDLAATMQTADGLGIAAPQIGRSEQVFLVSPAVCKVRRSEPLVFVNPTILWASRETVVQPEGCLSFPRVFTGVRRHAAVRVRALNAQGETFEEVADGLIARVVQHEYDHLIGKLLLARTAELALPTPLAS